MNLIEEIFLVIGSVMFFDAFFSKWGVWDWIAKEGSKSNSEFFFQLAQCRFCLRFHLSWIFTLFLSIFNGFGWSILAVPVVVSGFIHLIDKK